MTTGNNHLLGQAVRAALLYSGTLAAALAAQTSAAQTPPASTSDQPETAPAMTEVVVTGSRISSPNIEAISPITAVTAQEIRDTGVTRVEDLLNSLPQVVADQNSGLSMGTTGVANVNLRGLGATRTLILINGRRVIGGDPAGGGGSITNLESASAADINQIPVALIERVDVLTGGASSTYGADAVAGVVNFIMNTHFDGFRIDANIGIYNHDNHQSWLSPIYEAAGFTPVTGTNWDGANKDLTLILGNSFADGAGHFTGYLGYRRANPVAASHRDHSGCGLSFTGSPTIWSCAGSSNSAPTVIKTADLTKSSQVCDPALGCTTGAAGGIVNQYNHFNFANYFYLQRSDERYTAGFFGNLKLNEHAEAYTEFMFMDDQTQGNFGPAGMFLGSGFSVTPPGNPGAGIRNGAFTVNCGLGGYNNPGMNPFLTQNEFNTLCTPGNAYALYPDANGHTLPNGDIQLLMARRNVEGGPREDQYTHTTWRGVFGFRGEINSDWTYDSSLTYSVVRVAEDHNNDTSSRLMQDALLAVRDPTTGQIVCRSGNTGCIPWNIFNPAGPSAALAVPYFSVPAQWQSNGSEQIWTTFVSGDLTHAVKLPTADDGLKLVFGTEYRQETIKFSPDEEFLSADLAGIGSPVIGYQGGFHVWEGFTEARMPLVRNAPGFQVLDLEGGYRYSSYTSGFNTNTYKVGLTWAPIKDIRFRGSYNQAVRAPNAAELSKPIYVALDGSTDLCAVGTTFSAAQCAQTGLLTSQFPAAKSPSSQYNGQLGGNPHLQPETGKTTAVGLVFTPTFLPAFNATVDYSDIKMTNIISSYGSNFIQTQCINTGSPFWCSSTPPAFQPGIHRNAVGSLWSNPSGYVIDPLINLGGLRNKSVDVGLAYRQSLGKVGQLRARLDGTYLLNLITTVNTPAGSPSYDCAGHFGVSCQPVTPKVRFRLPVDWDTPVQGLSFGATVRYFGSATNTFNTPGSPDYIAGFPNLDPSVPSITYLDLRASYIWGRATLRVGCNNVTDKDPPFITLQTAGNDTQASTNTYPGVYDTSGRYLFANLTIDF